MCLLCLTTGGYLSWRNHSTDEDFDDRSDFNDRASSLYEFTATDKDKHKNGVMAKGYHRNLSHASEKSDILWWTARSKCLPKFVNCEGQQVEARTTWTRSETDRLCRTDACTCLGKLPWLQTPMEPSFRIDNSHGSCVVHAEELRLWISKKVTSSCKCLCELVHHVNVYDRWLIMPWKTWIFGRCKHGCRLQEVTPASSHPEQGSAGFRCPAKVTLLCDPELTELCKHGCASSDAQIIILSKIQHMDKIASLLWSFALCILLCIDWI